MLATPWAHIYGALMEYAKLRGLVDRKLSQRQIAEHAGVSQSTVRYWLSKHDLKTKAARGPRRPQGRNPKRYTQMECIHHGVTKFILEGRGYYRCVACRSERTQRDRRALKDELIEHLGGACSSCGYDRCVWALEFDHRNPDEKQYEMGDLIARRRRELAFKEVQKCDLLCSNCHKEREHMRYVGT